MEETERVVASSCGLYRAEIVRRPGGGYRVTVFRWMEEWVPEHGKVAAFWSRVSRSVTIADTPERAQALAEEELRSLGATPAAGGALPGEE